MRFRNKVVIVSGGSSGIGLEVVTQMYIEGAIVFNLDIQDFIDISPQLSDGIINRKIIFHKCDVSNIESVSGIVNEIVMEFGGVDILINNAGILKEEGLLHNTSIEDYNALLSVNIGGVFNLLKIVLNIMMIQKKGVIVTTASVTSLVGWEGIPVYNATKAASHMLTRSVALDYAKYGIRANSVAPANVNTPMSTSNINQSDDYNSKLREKANVHPINRMCETIDVANAILFLASEEASFITGVILPIDGGYTAK